MKSVLYLAASVALYAQSFDVAAFDRARVLKAADTYLNDKPITVTASHSPRSAGSVHDFFSEGDYWWPDPANPDGPYLQRDGMTNPDNFVAHRQALMRFSVQVPALAAAWSITHNKSYAAHAALHLRAWFVDDATRMNPNLQYSQAIHGRFTGRGIGIIDTIHLVEVARAIEVIAPTLAPRDLPAIRKWFADYTQWIMTHPYGIAERDATNNHGTCWAMQGAAFAHLTGDQKTLAYVTDRFKTVLLPGQEAEDGSFPQEMKRTKPYGYSLFNLEAFSTIAQILNLWTFELPDGRGMRKAVAFMAPYIRDKSKWPLKPDVMYDDQWPMRQSALLFAAQSFHNPDYLALWKTLPADSTVDETIRNFFIRQPVLWQTP
jgi:hypothetical protein